MTKSTISDRSRVIEIFCVILTVLGKFIFMDYLNLKLPFIIVAIFAWTSYVIYRSRIMPGITKYWGFRNDNFRQVIRQVVPFAIVSLIVFIGVGIYQGSVNFTWHIIPILVLYPIWGIIQQFLLIALTVGNLQDSKSLKLPKIVIVLICATLFGLIHYPYVWLMAGTYILAIFYCYIYMEQKNLYVLGIFHGWLAAFFFYTVVGRDPFVETFGKILKL